MPDEALTLFSFLTPNNHVLLLPPLLETRICIVFSFLCVNKYYKKNISFFPVFCFLLFMIFSSFSYPVFSYLFLHFPLYCSAYTTIYRKNRLSCWTETFCENTHAYQGALKKTAELYLLCDQRFSDLKNV